jgi:magnesium chelatase family protein
VQPLHLSARAFHRTLKLVRTIADLAGADVIGPAHVVEAMRYRPRQQMARPIDPNLLSQA